MIRLGVPTTRQDIKTDEPVSKPASKALLLPIIAFYLIVAAFLFLIGREIVPVAHIALNAKEIKAEADKFEREANELKAKIKKYENEKEYVNRKEKWAQTSMAAGQVMVEIFSALPQDVKLRGMNYEYRPGTQSGGSIVLQLQVRGTYEAGKLMAAIEQIDPRLVVSGKKPNLTEQGTDVQVEYQLK